MERLLIAVVLGALAAVVAAVVARRAAPVPSDLAGRNVPTQVQRVDFVRPEAPWLVVVFASSTCDACTGVWAKVQMMAADAVAVQLVDAVADAALHERYRIDGVPLTLVVDAQGVVEASFLGPVTATDLWAAVARLRTPSDDSADS